MVQRRRQSRASRADGRVRRPWLEALERRELLAATLTPSGVSTLAMVGTPVSGMVGSFSDSDMNAMAADFTATIMWGDGTMSSAGTVSGTSGSFDVAGSHIYTTAGSFPISIQVTDPSDSGTTTIYSSAAVSTSLLTPVSATIPAAVNIPIPAGTTIGSFFDADPGATASDFTAAINWGDGHSSVGTVTGTGGLFTVTGTNVYAAAKMDPITIFVQDTSGNTTTIDSTALVSSAVLTPVKASVAATVNVPIPASTLIGSFFDSALSTMASAFNAVITWGDVPSQMSQGTVVAVQGTPGLFDVEGSHTYSTAGNFTISILVNDSSGNTTTISSTATVFGPILTATPGLVTAAVNVPVSPGTTVGSFFDSQTTAKASGFTAVITWGNGNTSAGMVAAVMGTPGLFTVAGTNLYTTAGNDPVTITVSDANGNTVMIPSTAVVTGTMLVATGMTFSVTLGQPLPTQAIATFIDQSSTANAGNITAAINWGDGQMTTGTVVSSGPNGLYSVMGSHTYPVVALATSPVNAPPLSVPVSVTITDPSGQTAIADGTALIVNASPSTPASSAGSSSSSTVNKPRGASEATGDVLGNGTTETVVGAPVGDLPIVTVYNSATGAVLSRFLAYSPGYRGGVVVAIGSSNGMERGAVLTWKVGRHGRTDGRAFDGLTGVALGHPSVSDTHSHHARTGKPKR